MSRAALEEDTDIGKVEGCFNTIYIYSVRKK